MRKGKKKREVKYEDENDSLIWSYLVIYLF
jgi:hypothetical protein